MFTMDPPLSGVYDVLFTVNGVDMGFMLVSPPDQTKQIAFAEVGPPDSSRISLHFATDNAYRHLDFAPQYDVSFTQSSWNKGLGQLYFDSGDENGYWWGNVITHVDGKVYPPFSVSDETFALAAALAADGTGAGRGRPVFRSYVTSAGVRTDYAMINDEIGSCSPGTTNTWGSFISNLTNSGQVSDLYFFGGHAFVCVPDSTDAVTDFIQYTLPGLTGTAIKNHTAFSVGNKPKFMCAVGGTTWAAVDNGKVYYNVDPTADSWVGPVTVGDGNYPFQNMIAVNDYLFVFTTNAGYSIDSNQRVSEIFYKWKTKPSTENFKYVATDGTLLYFSAGPEVYAYDPVTGLTVATKIARRDGFSTQSILGVTSDEKYLYVMAKVRLPALYSSTQMVILRAPRVAVPNGWDFPFECIYQETYVANQVDRGLTTVPLVGGGGAGTNLYWASARGTSNGDEHIEHIYMPPDWDESHTGTDGSTGTSFTNGYLYTSITRANYNDFSKRYLWLDMELEGVNALATTGKVEVAYSIDKGATFVALGDSTTADATGYLALDFTDIEARTILLRFKLTSVDGATTPCIRTFSLHQRVRFKYLPQATLNIRVADGLNLNSGINDVNRSATQILADLATIRTTDRTVRYRDFCGNDFDVSIDSFSWHPIRHERPIEKPESEAVLVISRADRGA